LYYIIGIGIILFRFSKGILQAMSEDTDANTSAAYEATRAWMEQSPPGFIEPRVVPSVVKLRDIITEPIGEHEEVASLYSPGKGKKLLNTALQELGRLEKVEAELMFDSPLTAPLTQIATNQAAFSPQQALAQMQVCASASPRKVCQYPFKKNDIVWMCRTCQADDTCALCHDCFSNSNHEGHDVAFYHAQEGGCCDCGDAEAWDPKGFCPKHGEAAQPPRRAVCQYPFKKNDIVWMCRTCQTDDTCAMCHECYNNSNHEGHDVQFFHAQEGGCCDCGDPEAWDPKGFCPNHGPLGEDYQHQQHRIEDLLAPGLIPRVRGAIPAIMDWMIQRVVTTAQESSQRTQLALEEAEACLGALGKDGHGIYVVIQADDVHSTIEFADGMRHFFGSSIYLDDALVRRLAQALNTLGQLVVWGTTEIATELGRNQVQKWLSGDTSVHSALTSILVQRVTDLKRSGFNCKIMTLKELQQEQQAIAVIQWMSALAFSCDPLCQTVADYIHPEKHLEPLLKADFLLSSRFTKGWYSLLLTLLAVPAFKSKLGAAYCETYGKLTEACAMGRGVLERSAYTLSVQFLNRDTYVLDLVSNRDLLSRLGKALLATLRAATSSRTGRLDCNHVVLAHRRYSPCISDLNYVINVKGMRRLTTCKEGSFMNDMVEGMSLTQCIDEHTWRHWDLGHVEDEDTGWYGAFNLCITLGGLFERILAFEDDDASPVMNSASPLSKNLQTCLELSEQVLMDGLAPWQAQAARSFFSTPYSSAVDPHRRRPKCLPFSTVAAKRGCTSAFQQLAVGQMTPFSLHIPLHRLFAGCIREICLRPDETGVVALLRRLTANVAKPVLDDAFEGLLEYPVMVMSRAAQVRAGLWRRNGPGLNEQVIKYSDPTFCRSMRDSDLLLTQFALLRHTATQSPVMSDSVSKFVHLLLHRLGLFDFVGLGEAPSADYDTYEAETAQGLYPCESGEENSSKAGLVLPWTYTPARDAADCRVLLEEFLYILIIFLTELPPPAPKNNEDHTEQAKARLRREVIHRLAASPKTHSELADIHLVLSFRDNVLLNELGKTINPDDATAAMLGQVLGCVAERKASRSRLEPDKFVLLKPEWKFYDPTFFHISVESHQTAAESRPVPAKTYKSNQEIFGATMPYAPSMPTAHPQFQRLRRDITADAAILVVAFRILHMHCRSTKMSNMPDLLFGSQAYDDEAKSETSLARAVHLLTLGCYAWEDAAEGNSDWLQEGGGSPGSVFFGNKTSPTVVHWIEAALLKDPCELLDCNWYTGEDNALLLLRRLAVDGGAPGVFVAQDPAVQAGAAWICEFAVAHSPVAANLICRRESADANGLANESELEWRNRIVTETGTERVNAQSSAFATVEQTELWGINDYSVHTNAETDFQKRKRKAKEKALARMNDQAVKFATAMGVEISQEGEEEAKEETAFERKKRLAKEMALAKIHMQASKFASSVGLELTGERAETDLEKRKRLAKERALVRMKTQASRFAILNNIELGGINADLVEVKSEHRQLSSHEPLRQRPQCIICSDGDAECFVAFAQASTVMKGGGGPADTDDFRMETARRFVGTFVALCGHAVHSDCSASYLAKVKQTFDQTSGDYGEFRCPLCQRPSNCLVPFVDVERDWIEAPTCLPAVNSAAPSFSLHSFLNFTSWWTSRQKPNSLWDGHGAFYSADSSSPLADSHEEGDLISGNVRIVKDLMETLYGLSYEADSNRLGSGGMRQDTGEFRHYTIEKHFYKMSGSACSSFWPPWLAPGELTERERYSFSREHYFAQILMSIQAFTYSVCSEAFEARRIIRDRSDGGGQAVAAAAAAASVDKLKPVYSKFGISGTVCDGHVILMPPPSSTEDEGSQPFNGRLGRLRNFGLVAMAAAGAAGPDLVQLTFPFPVNEGSKSKTEKVARAPIAKPLLFGHVLTHTVTAFCASAGRALAPDSWRQVLKGKMDDMPVDVDKARVDVVSEDCEGFMKLGLLARTVQVLCKELHITFLNAAPVVKILESAEFSDYQGASQMEQTWLKTCRMLLIVVIGNSQIGNVSKDGAGIVETVKGSFRKACLVAAGAAASFLADAGTIVQLLVPSIMARYEGDYSDPAPTIDDDDDDQDASIRSLNMLQSLFRMESIEEMLKSELVVQVASNWFSEACAYAKREPSLRSEAGLPLLMSPSFRSWDWPLASVCDYKSAEAFRKKQVVSGVITGSPTPPKKTFPLLGGYNFDIQNEFIFRPRIKYLTHSYMDLYAQVGALKPDADRTAVCLICGKALDSSGIGECTAHSYSCGAGVGICFLLQECVGIILQGGEGSFIHSIYVDSHGMSAGSRKRKRKRNILVLFNICFAQSVFSLIL